MATYGIVPKTFDGIDLVTADYHFQFVEDAQTLDSPAAQAVKSTRPGRTPQKAFVQPDGMTIVLEAVIDEISQDNYDALKGMFDTLAGEDHVLVVTDGNDVDRQVSCTIQKWTVSNIGNTVFKVALDAPSGFWESATAADDTPLVLDSPSDTFSLTNDGNTQAPLILSLSPQAAIDEGDGYHLAQRIYLANKSEQPLTHFAAEGYAIDITDGGLDTATLEGAGKVLDSLDDLRVWLNSRELLRWCSPATSNASTKIWCNIAMRPGRFATLVADIDGDSTVIQANSIDGFVGWERDGWLFIGSEPCVYHLEDDFTATLTYRPDSATHSDGADITWIEHVLILTYGFTNAGTPDAGDDAKPVIDLSASGNTEHHWGGPFFNDNDRRSMTWRRTVEGDSSPYIRVSDDGTAMLFEDELPETGKPLGQQVEVRFPVPCVGPLELDRSVDVGIGLHGYAADLQGFESQLIEVISGTVSDDSYSLDNEMTRLRLKAFISAVTGEVGTNTNADPFTVVPDYAGPGRGSDDTIDLYARARQAIHFTLDQDTEIREFILQTDSLATTIGFQVTSEDRTQLIWAGAFIVGSDGDWSAGGIAAVFPAGGYWIILDTTVSGNLLTKQRSKARLFSTSILLPDDYAYEDTALTTLHFANSVPVLNNAVNYPGYAGYGYYDVLPAFHTPLFGVISVKQDPQSDAPLQSGNTVSIDNVIAPLDSDRAPQIFVGDEFDLFPIIGTLTNNETGDAAAITFLCEAGEALELDCDEGHATDMQTGLSANYAVEYSNPTKRLYLAKGANEFAIAIAGVSVSAALEVTPGYRHAWL